MVLCKCSLGKSCGDQVVFYYHSTSKNPSTVRNKILNNGSKTIDTHLKFNIAPEKLPSQKESNLPTIIFQSRAVKLRGCMKMMADQKPIATFKQNPGSPTQLVADHGGPACVDCNSIAVLPVAHRNGRLEGRSGDAQARDMKGKMYTVVYRLSMTSNCFSLILVLNCCSYDWYVIVVNCSCY